MDVNLKLNIIGLGVGRILWTRLSRLFAELLAPEHIEARFGYYNNASPAGYRRYLDKRAQGDPDIIVTTFGLYSDLQILEQVASQNSAFSTAGPPRIFFLEKNIRRFLGDLLANQPSVRFDFRRFGELHVQDLDLFALPGEKTVRLEVVPAPEIMSYSEERALFIGGRNAAFCRLSAIREISWLDRSYTVPDFVEAVFSRHAPDGNRQPVKLLQKEDDSIFLTNGISLDELNAISFNYLQIDHVIAIDQLRKGTATLERFLAKAREIAKARCCRVFSANRMADEPRIKSLVPIVVGSDYPVINDVFRHVLTADGYQRVESADPLAETDGRLLLHLAETAEAPLENPLQQNLLLEREIFNIAGFPKVTRKRSARPPDLTGYESVETIRTERMQVVRKLKKLEDQIKNLSGSRILADQERYMNMLAGRKLEIITVLLEMAEVWTESDEAPKRTYEENVLVFHDDPLQAATINNRLEGDGKRLFVDVTRKFGTLRDFVTLNTDMLEPFLHEGFIFCYAGAKAFSERKMQAFQEELADKTYPEIAKGIENLKTERSKLQKTLLDLAYLEAYQLLSSSYREQAALVYDAAKKALRYLEKRRFSTTSLKRICFFAAAEEHCHPVQRAVSGLLGGGLKSSGFDRILLPLQLATEVSAADADGLEEMAGSETANAALVREAVIQNNLRLLSSYLKKAVREFQAVSADLLVLIHDLDLIAMLVRMMRSSGGPLERLPLLAIFYGPLKMDRIAELIDQNVLPVYYDSLFCPRDNDLLEQLRAVFE